MYGYEKCFSYRWRSWGTCLSEKYLLVENGNNVYLWEYNEEVRKAIKEEETKSFLPGIKLPEELKIVDDYAEVLQNEEKYAKIDAILLATPTQF